jgi:hypothetical protein
LPNSNEEKVKEATLTAWTRGSWYSLSDKKYVPFAGVFPPHIFLFHPKIK